jgi:hypothetical protein
MGRVARENDHGPGRIGFKLTRVELITQSYLQIAAVSPVRSLLGPHCFAEFAAVACGSPK